MAQQSTFLEELMAAGRGVISLLIGDRKAGSYFDFSQRGLLGSFIAFLLVTGLNAALPVVLGIKDAGGIARSIVMVAILFVLQVGCSAIVLRQLKRMDGLLPYVVADNWATFFLTLISGALAAVLAEGYALTDALQWASGAAACCVTRAGAQEAMADRAEVEALVGNAVSLPLA